MKICNYQLFISNEIILLHNNKDILTDSYYTDLY